MCTVNNYNSITLNSNCRKKKNRKDLFDTYLVMNICLYNIYNLYNF